MHVVLLGDSIFDNASYVPGGPAVIDHLRTCLGEQGRATLLARDGDICAGVPDQLASLPADATHLFLSVGGNDALGASGMLHDTTRHAVDGFDNLARVQAQFRSEYERTLASLLDRKLPTAVCTIYSAIPGLSPRELAGLSVFNDVIVACAVQRGLAVIDLRTVCDRPEDYSSLSPIEPSEIGGRRIARALHRVLTEHDYASGRTVIFGAA